ncbi:Acg family FMN-binding oxidoreductase [Actinoplanes sp. NPDC049265]|uniref:Acg family FMN-binding oxidoreductase n=1 Tax=Actinoplanes sp. NPDC049265 TaxID=3363902 RepID=UPI003712491B
MSAIRETLASAARTALHAPSVFNTQPWVWRVTADALQLWSDPARQLEITDPEGRLLMLSLGAALHHARVALAAAGHDVAVDRLPDHHRPDLIAELRVTGTTPVAPATEALAAAIERRRTDRRAFGDRAVPGPVIDGLRAAVEAEGAYLHLLRPDQVVMLGISAELAEAAEADDPDYRAEIDRWTTRTPWDGDGVPATTAVAPGLRRVPVRDFAPDRIAGLPVGGGRDQGAEYAVVFGTGDDRIDLLHAGEALSALLLRATADGLSTAPLTDAIEVSWPRHLVRELLAGTGEPFVVVRLGYSDAGRDLPPAPRRRAEQVIEIEP